MIKNKPKLKLVVDNTKKTDPKILQLFPSKQDSFLDTDSQEKGTPLSKNPYDLNYFELMVHSEIVLQGSLAIVVSDPKDSEGIYQAVHKIGKDKAHSLFLTFLESEMDTLITCVLKNNEFPPDKDLFIFIDETVHKILDKIISYAKEEPLC
jgi:hypothetical protein